MGGGYPQRRPHHQYVVGADGTLRHLSGIDDRVTPDPADIPEPKPYVRAAFEDLAAGRPVADAVYVLHCFENKPKKTSKTDLDLAAKRYRDLIQDLGQ
jgi:hypothetical protein